jgi:hypothetical protein
MIAFVLADAAELGNNLFAAAKYNLDHSCSGASR